MGLSDCEKCWNRLCSCGYQYRDFNIQTVGDSIDELEKYDRELPVKIDAFPFEDARDIHSVNPSGDSYKNPDYICLNNYD